MGARGIGRIASIRRDPDIRPRQARQPSDGAPAEPEGEEEPANDTPSFKILKEFRDGTHKVTVSKGQNTIDLEVAAE